MKRHIINTTLFLVLLGFCAAGNVAARVTRSSDWTLSMLRGSWKFHTFEDKWTLVFESDHNLIIDRNDARYTLLPGSIRVTTNNDSTDYPYALDGNKLTLQLPDGSARTYKKTGDGEAEQKVKGILYAEIDSTGDKAHLSFDGKHSFQLTDEVGEDIGAYRVEGSAIILALNDTTSYTTQIKSWNDNGRLDEVAFDGRLYASEKPAAVSIADSPHIESSVSVSNAPSEESSPSFLEILGRIFFGGTPASQTESEQPAASPSSQPAPAAPAASTQTRTENTRESAPVRTFGSKRPPKK
jgi:hypothetical protein